MSRVYNFSAGPAVLPEEVLQEAADEMLDYRGCGMSVMEMSHRSKAFEEIINSAEQDLRDLMNIPDNYKVLFMQGGASQQFAMIPMNFMKNRVADYIITGQWAKKAAKEAEKYGKVNRIASSEDQTFSYIPDCSDLPVSEDADYVYICENNTIYGTKFKELPTGGFAECVRPFRKYVSGLLNFVISGFYLRMCRMSSENVWRRRGVSPRSRAVAGRNSGKSMTLSVPSVSSTAYSTCDASVMLWARSSS